MMRHQLSWQSATLPRSRSRVRASCAAPNYLEALRRNGRVAMQRIANPSTSVRLRVPPPFNYSTCFKQQTRCPSGGIGRHKGFKIPRLTSRAGSSPASGTTLYFPCLFQFNYSSIKPLIIKSHYETSILLLTLNYYVCLKPLCHIL